MDGSLAGATRRLACCAGWLRRSGHTWLPRQRLERTLGSLLLTLTLLLPLAFLPRLATYYAPAAPALSLAPTALPSRAPCQALLVTCDRTTAAPTTETAMVTLPLTPTITATPLPSSVIVRAGALAVIEGQSAVTVPLDLVEVPAEPAIGVLSVDVQYDAAVLQATACRVGSSFDLLLCNLETPGLLQLAGVVANGIRSDVRVADLGFDLLPPISHTIALTVQLETVADIEGTALAATGQNGQIVITCRPGSEDCQTLFLPLVHR